MTHFKKTLLGAAATLALAAPVVNASVINVGGVTWDPDSTNPVQDFFMDASFDQWFQAPSTAVTPDPSERIDFDNTNPALLIGNYIFGSGFARSINGVDNIPGPTSTPALFCDGCELTYEFGGILISGYNTTSNVFTFDITSAYAKVYVDHSADWGNIIRPDLTNANNGQLFLDLKFASFSLTPTTTVSGGNADAQLYVNNNPLALATSNFDTNPATIGGTTMLPGADITYSSSTQLVVPQTGNPNRYLRGTAEILANTVPEPATLALLGIGLIGVGGFRVGRNRRSS